MALGYDKSRVRQLFDIEAIRIRDRIVHPECRNDDEVSTCVEFLRGDRVPDVLCSECGLPLSQLPYA